MTEHVTKKQAQQNSTDIAVLKTMMQGMENQIKDMKKEFKEELNERFDDIKREMQSLSRILTSDNYVTRREYDDLKQNLTWQTRFTVGTIVGVIIQAIFFFLNRS